jgi:MYXO-CTERM domain-containing protein
VRRSRRSSVVGLLAALMIAGASGPMSAHRRDEYLQAARIAVDPDRVRVELDLTAGIAVADTVLAGIDTDRDGAISSGEAQAYVAIVRQAVRMDIDAAPLSLALVGSAFPQVAAMRAGEGSIRLAFAVALPRLDAGRHNLRYRNAHRADVGVYLANALVPDNPRVAITGQQRDAGQRELIIAYDLHPSPPGSGVVPFAASVGVAVLVLAALGWRRRRRMV